MAGHLPRRSAALLAQTAGGIAAMAASGLLLVLD
jgi:hypothetical protein